MSSGALAFDALVLGGDGRPVSTSPLSIIPWEEAVKGLLTEKLYRVASYDRVVRSATKSIELPSVVMLTRYHVVRRTPVFSRYNIFLRDGFTCQYCPARPGISNLTLDHVVPRAAGGTTIWTNVVACCMPCNQRKGHKSLKAAGMVLRKVPVMPTRTALNSVRRNYPPGFLHESWIDFMYWDTPLEE